MQKYSVIYADPPWQYDDRKCSEEWRGTPYPTLDLDALKTLPVHRMAAPDCALFLWATNPLLPEAFEVMRGWGFEFKTVAFVWRKLNTVADTDFIGLGRWTRGNTEPCLLGVRGKPKRVGKGVRQLIHAPVARHSAKPKEARRRIEALMGDVPRVELFARQNDAGWESTGLDLDGLDIRTVLAAYEETT